MLNSLINNSNSSSRIHSHHYWTMYLEILEICLVTLEFNQIVGKCNNQFKECKFTWSKAISLIINLISKLFRNSKISKLNLLLLNSMIKLMDKELQSKLILKLINNSNNSNSSILFNKYLDKFILELWVHHNKCLVAQEWCLCQEWSQECLFSFNLKFHLLLMMVKLVLDNNSNRILQGDNKNLILI
jgi:hypothetical protein